MFLSKAVPQRLKLTLRSYASKLEAGTLPPDEKAQVISLIRCLAEGQSLDEIYSIWRPANRPTDPSREMRIREMAELTLSKQWGGAGMRVDEASTLIADRYGRKASTLRSQYYSPEGQKIRKETQKRGQMIAELRDQTPFGGRESPE